MRFISGGNATSGLRAREAGLSLIVSAPIQCAVRIASSRGTAHEWPRRQGALIATPQLRLLSGRQGRLDLDGEWASNPVLKGLRERIEITPAVRGDDITLTFAIASGDKQFRPALVISKERPRIDRVEGRRRSANQAHRSTCAPGYRGTRRRLFRHLYTTRKSLAPRFRPLHAL